MAAEGGEEEPGGPDILSGLLDADEGRSDDVSAEVGEKAKRLRMALRNETGAPEVLPFEGDLVKSIREILDAQEELVDLEEEEGSNGTVSEIWIASYLKKIELSRLNYLLRAYYRSRLRKIESWTRWVLRDSEMQSRLSAEELKYANDYQEILDKHLTGSFLNLLPERLRSLNDKDGDMDLATPPDIDRYVFCRVQKSVGSMAVGESPRDDPITLNKDDLYCVRYRPIRNLVISGDVRLM